MMYVLIGICAASIVLNMLLASYCTRTSHWAKFWKEELKREQMGVRPVEIKQKVPIEVLDAQVWESDGG